MNSDQTSELSTRQRLVSMYLDDRPLAHRVLFAHRRAQTEAPFHEELIRDFH
ncbi:MAG: hypothetical protein OK454_08695 [Thaumarchaeota archaeon]|nr:hypothetical protein [Nitrososphaerota archaeon]